jgi:tyrosine-protein phosphatase SIW14
MRFCLFTLILLVIFYVLGLMCDLWTMPANPYVTMAALTPRRDFQGLANFAIISEGLYRGEQPGPEGFATLKKMGVKTIVNLRLLHSDRDALLGTGLQYVHLRCQAWHPEAEDVAQFIKIVRDEKNQPVFVHCQHGSDRTGMMVASYRILEQGWTPAEAASEVYNFGYHRLFRDIRSFMLEFNDERMRKLVERTPEPAVETIN